MPIFESRGPGWVTIGNCAATTYSADMRVVYNMDDVNLSWLAGMLTDTTSTTTPLAVGMDWAPLPTSVTGTWTTNIWTTVTAEQVIQTPNPYHLDPGEEQCAAREQEARWYVQDTERREQVEARQAAREGRYAAEVAQQLQARNRARDLLMAHLDAQQKRDVLEHDWFEVCSDRGRRWRIRMQGIVGNVDLMPEVGSERLASYCAHSPGDLPSSDHFLAQKLVLETDEQSFLNVANIHWRDYNIFPDGRIPA